VFEERMKRNLTVLMVEDNLMDVVLTEEVLSESERNTYRMEVAKDGVEAMRFLLRLKGHEKTPRPDVMLLDLNLPRMHGFDLLSKMKRNVELKDIPVFVLSTSTNEKDVQRAKELGVDGYLLKPLDLDQFEEEIFRRMKAAIPEPPLVKSSSFIQFPS
jgi:two-component system, chemotaxis family, response regulator Rcp1